MATRQSHRKIRNSCSNCRRRHVKCDEQGPPCANCRVRELDCDFATRVSTAPNAGSNSGGHGLQVPTGNRLFELELLHRWSTDTYKTITYPNDDELWQRTVPERALKNDFLLNAVFAVSALHIAATTASAQARLYQLAALEYQNLAIAAFRENPAAINEDTYEPIYVFSILNFILSIAVPYYCPEDVKTESIKNNLVTAFHLLHGPVSVIRESRSWMETGPFQNTIALRSEDPREDLGGNVGAALSQLKSTAEARYRSDLDSTRRPVDTVYAYERISKAIEKLHLCFDRYQAEGPLVCFSWLATLDREFIDAITNVEPIAILITIHWAVLLEKLGETKWWARSSGKLLVVQLSRDLSPQNPEWKSMISWVNQQVGLPVL